MKIYVASSWRNMLQPGIVHALRRCGHEVYDFKHPFPGNDGFSWKEIEPNYDGVVSPETYLRMRSHPVAQAGYETDIKALRECEAVVYVLPCGRAASWEFGYAMGQGKRGYVIMFQDDQPDLMFMEATVIHNMDMFFAVFGEPLEGSRPKLHQSWPFAESTIKG